MRIRSIGSWIKLAPHKRGPALNEPTIRVRAHHFVTWTIWRVESVLHPYLRLWEHSKVRHGLYGG